MIEMFCYVVGTGLSLLLVAVYDRTALDYTQKISVPASRSTEMCMCTGAHEYNVPGMACGSCVLMIGCNMLVSFGFWRAFWSILQILGWRITEDISIVLSVFEL